MSQYMDKICHFDVQTIIDMQVKQQLQIIKDDPYLQPYEDYYLRIRTLVDQKLGQFHAENGLDQVSQSYKRYGIHKVGKKYIYREWAPEAQYLSIFGEFNGWKRGQYIGHKNQFGLWTCEIDAHIPHLSPLKVQVKIKDGSIVDRIPAWINFTRQNQDLTFDGVYVDLGLYSWKNKKPEWPNTNIKVYQCHIGMSGIEQKVHSFNYFRENVLPRINHLGYNVIQIMGIIEHPYYGSFGYHCTNFFSVSSRFGTPCQFKQLIDEAHGMGIKVVIDLVHSHAAKNVLEGINLWDGSDYQYFHSGEKGNHPIWDSKVFDYSKYEVLRFLLSNIRFWLEQYNADGYRFDGVTSMLYQHHGKNYGFTGNYNEYFNHQLNINALAYLTMANQLARLIYPQVILIAEDVSGFPGLCRVFEQGGIGFGFRMAMAVPDMWIKLLKQCRDEDWNVGEISFQLTNRRYKQPCIAYAQSHDQALVGDKTISMWLFDSEIYSNMSVFSEETPKIFRGMAVHKMIRLISFSLGNQGYLSFMGNQFGHPEWIDFPRQGNNWSYNYCRRRWDLSERTDLRYNSLLSFDKLMIDLDVKYSILASDYQYVRYKHEKDQILVYQRGDLLFVFNFNPHQSFSEYPIYTKHSNIATVILSTDDKQTGGHQRVSHQTYSVTKIDDFVGKFSLYVPSRCAIVFKLEK